jgi:RHS repeat-associated protein
VDYPDRTHEEWTRDLHGNTLVYANAKGAETRYKYDAADRVVQAYLPDGNIIDYGYDNGGNISSIRDADHQIHTRYNLFGDITERTDSIGTVGFRYDTEGRLVHVTNESGERYVFHRDSEGDLSSETGFDGITRDYERDYTGRVLSMTLNDKYRTGYGYDDFGRMIRITRSDGSEETFDYDVSGLLRKAVNGDAEVCFERDVMGRIVKESCNGHVIESTFNVQGRRTRLTSSLGADIEAAYNPFGDLENIGMQGWKAGMKFDPTGLETQRMLPGNLTRRTTHDRLGRITGQEMFRNVTEIDKKEYLWGRNDRLLSVIDNGKMRQYSYNSRGFLTQTHHADGTTEIRVPDNTGNLYEALNRSDRKYGNGGQLQRTEHWEYKYDREGNLIRKRDKHGATWRYEWNAAGMLSKVKRPDAREVFFRYDALGRRIEKEFGNAITTWLWDGNTPLHEWTETYHRDWDSEKKQICWDIRKQPLITYIFEEGTFVPAAKIAGDKAYSIVTDYLGTPVEAYDTDGNSVWERELNSYGRVRTETGTANFVPFAYSGQYIDEETGLGYNRFRYIDYETGSYISQDPIGLAGNNPTLYAYVHDPNSWIDPFGLAGTGGAYMFGFENGNMYIGKGEVGRMGDSISTRQVQAGNSPLIGKAHVSTGGNNELGKMVEYRAMKNARFERGDIPKNYQNTYLSGETAWNNPNNKHLQGQASDLADKMRADYDADVKTRKNAKLSCGG